MVIVRSTTCRLADEHPLRLRSLGLGLVFGLVVAASAGLSQVPELDPFSQRLLIESVIEGIVEVDDLGSCSGCANSVARALKRVDGVVEATLHDDPAGVALELSSTVEVDMSSLRQSVRDVGFDVGAIWLRIEGEIQPHGDGHVLAPRSSWNRFEIEIGEHLENRVGPCVAVLKWRDAGALPLLTACSRVVAD